MKTKKCSKCQKTKTAACFSVDNRAKSGLRSWCKECSNAYDVSPAGKAAHKKYEDSAHGKAARKEYEKSSARKKSRKKYFSSPAGKAVRERYENSPKRAIARERYMNSDTCKTYNASDARKTSFKNYRDSAKGKATRSEYRNSFHGKASQQKTKAKRKGIPQELYVLGDSCEICGSAENLSADHLIPVAFKDKYGVSSEIIGSAKNMATFCVSCNASKNARLADIPKYLNRTTRLLGAPTKSLFPVEAFWKPVCGKPVKV